MLFPFPRPLQVIYYQWPVEWRVIRMDRESWGVKCYLSDETGIMSVIEKVQEESLFFWDVCTKKKKKRVLVTRFKWYDAFNVLMEHLQVRFIFLLFRFWDFCHHLHTACHLVIETDCTVLLHQPFSRPISVFIIARKVNKPLKSIFITIDAAFSIIPLPVQWFPLIEFAFFSLRAKCLAAGAHAVAPCCFLSVSMTPACVSLCPCRKHVV